MTIEVCRDASRAPVLDPASVITVAPEEVSIVDRIASVVADISVIGEARNALQIAGWSATIAANRITVDDAVVAQLILSRECDGALRANWIVSAIAGDDSVRFGGAA